MERNVIEIPDEVIYIAELDADVDDVVAAEYLHNRGALKGVVLDPIPQTPQGKERLSMLKELGIRIMDELPTFCWYVFVGGALTAVAKHIKKGGHIEHLVMNGGFVGSNLVYPEDQLEKFKGKQTVRTFNFNCDVTSTEYVLKTDKKQIGDITFIGKNVCHSKRNTEECLWSDAESKVLFTKYQVRPGKCQHDMLACHEGLALFHLGGIEEKFCAFTWAYPYNDGINGNMTRWGSSARYQGYRKIRVAIAFAERKDVYLAYA